MVMRSWTLLRAASVRTASRHESAWSYRRPGARWRRTKAYSSATKTGNIMQGTSRRLDPKHGDRADLAPDGQRLPFAARLCQRGADAPIVVVRLAPPPFAFAQAGPFAPRAPP